MVNNNNNKPDIDDEVYNEIEPESDCSNEQTLDEEEYLSANDDINKQEEIDILEKEKDMPIKDLLALYNYDQENICYELNTNVNSHLQELLQPISENSNQEDSVENDPDFILDSEKTEWKTTIMVGKEYQVDIPELISEPTATISYENQDLLLWDPKIMSDDEIAQFLRNANSSKTQFNKSQVKDDAQFLYALMENDYDVDETLKMKKENPIFLFDEITPFTDTECLAFEQGLIKHGKDFWKIQQNFVKTRSVKELVHFYYLWKKTERHDAFVVKNRTQKKRYLINPGLTDYMDRFFRDPNNSAKNKENCVESIPGIINSEQTNVEINCNDENGNSISKITRSKSKAINNV